MGLIPHATPEEERWMIVFRTGWTLETVDALSEKDWKEFFAIRDGKLKSRTW
jgi:hypothetical protein